MAITSKGSYNPLEALNAARQDRMARGEGKNGNSQETPPAVVPYQEVLEWVQNKISSSETYNRVLQDCLGDDTGEEQLRSVIFSLLQNYPVLMDNETITQYTDNAVNDMCGFGLLTPYIEDPSVEEINVYGPGPRQVEVLTNNRGIFMLEEGFPNEETVQNMAKRMVRKGGMTIDLSNPRVDSYLESGTRVSAMIPPVIRDDKGAVLSIRKQTKASISKEDLVAAKTVMAEELAFLELCTRNKVSGAVVGPTGSGKTTLLNYLMSDYVTNGHEQTRVYIIEESRELQLPDDARVIYTAVCGDEKNNTLISAPDLLKSALRFHPTFISCAEMRGEEAMNAMNAGQTGHIVWSTFHADNCEAAYQRLLTMCKMSGTDLSENLLMRNLVEAFPIVVSAQQLRDGTRKVTGIYEATGVDGSSVRGHYIYRMMIDHFEYDEHGKVVRVHGAHCRVGDLSDKMAQRIFDNCGLADKVRPFARKGWEPERWAFGRDQDMAGRAFAPF